MNVPVLISDQYNHTEERKKKKLQENLNIVFWVTFSQVKDKKIKNSKQISTLAGSKRQ